MAKTSYLVPRVPNIPPDTAVVADGGATGILDSVAIVREGAAGHQHREAFLRFVNGGTIRAGATLRVVFNE